MDTIKKIPETEKRDRLDVSPAYDITQRVFVEIFSIAFRRAYFKPYAGAVIVIIKRLASNRFECV